MDICMLNKKQKLLLTALSIIYFLAVIFVAYDVRGTDQFWYLDEFSNFVKTGTFYSNFLYPYFLCNFGISDLQPPIHNCYLQALFFFPAFVVLGVKHGFFVMNALCCIISAYIAFKIVLKWNRNTNYALFAFFLVLFLPTTFFYSLNMLMEIFLMFCVGVSSYLWILYFEKKSLAYGLSAFFVALFFVLIYPIFIAQSLFILIHIIWENRKKRFSYYLAALFLFIPLMMVVEKIFMPSLAGILRLTGILSINQHIDYANMIQFFSLEEFGSLSDWILYRIWRLSKSLSFLPALATMAVGVFLYATSFIFAVKRRGIALFCFFLQSSIILPLFVIFFAHQYQFRYSIIYMIIMLPTFFWLLEKLPRFFSMGGVLFLSALFFIFVDIAIAKSLINDISNEREYKRLIYEYAPTDTKVLDAIYLGGDKTLCVHSHIHEIDFTKLGLDLRGKYIITRYEVDGNRLNGIKVGIPIKILETKSCLNGRGALTKIYIYRID